MSLPDALEMVYRTLVDPLAVLVTPTVTEVNTELRMVDEGWAINSVQGWKFRAGRTLREQLHVGCQGTGSRSANHPQGLEGPVWSEFGAM